MICENLVALWVSHCFSTPTPHGIRTVSAWQDVTLPSEPWHVERQRRFLCAG